MPADSDLNEGELFRALFRAAADAILIVGEDGRIVLANAASERLLGYAAGELAGRDVEDLVPGCHANQAQLHLEFGKSPRARPLGRGDLELYARHADGRDIPVDISLTPLEVGGRRLAGCSIRDLRQRARGPESLRVQTKALRSAANGILITDHTGHIAWVNPAVCRITGYSSDELMGQHTRILKSGAHDAGFYRDLWETVTRGDTWSGTIVNRRKDGTRYQEEQTIAPVTDEDGSITHFIAIKQDVTEQRRTQEALEQAHDELAARVVEIQDLNERLRDQALRDPLTGLHNRRYLQEVAPREVARVVRSGRSLAVAALDVDRFKAVNDAHGHATGDQLLRRLAEVLHQSLRTSDLVCRVGGEEFLVLLPGIPPRAVKSRAERWRAAFAAASVTSPEGEDVRSTLSIGIALLRPEENNLEAAWRRADAALYEAKARGRDRLVCDGDLE